MEKRAIIRIIFLFFVGLTTVNAQTNLLDTSTWTVGTGSALGFNKYGSTNENGRIMGTTPFGTQDVLWVGTPDGTSDTSVGGWLTGTIAINHNSTYRFTVWIKKNNSFDGNAIFKSYTYDSSAGAATLKLDDTSTINPIFQANDVSTLNKWYLYVGFMHSSNYTGSASIGGVYDPVNGTMIMTSTDYKFSTTASMARHTANFYASTNISDSVEFYAPTIYEVNGQEPTIQELIDGPNGNTADIQSPTIPTGLTATNSNDTSADLSWNASTDNTAVAGYHIYNNGSSAPILSTTGLGTSTTLTNLSSGTSYQLSIAAYDAAGNTSTQSSPVVSVTTTSSGGGSGTTSGNWNQSGSNINYTNGNVAVGTTTIPSGYKMAIDGKLITEEVKVQLSGEWADYVFYDDYKLPTLQEVEKHIQEKGHLINIPSAKEVETNGFELGEMNKLLLEKIEELTLYILEMKKEIIELKKNHN